LEILLLINLQAKRYLYPLVFDEATRKKGREDEEGR